MRVLSLFLILSLISTAAVAAGPAPTLAQKTVQAWCTLGHGGHAPAKLGALTWDQFDLLAGTVHADIDPKLSMMEQMPADARGAMWQMEGVSSQDEYVFQAWLIGLASPSPMHEDPLPKDVDAVRGIAAALRKEVAAKAGPFKDADDRKRTAKALAQFARFEKLTDRFAPALSGRCKS
jgi:hypothetical protein